MVLTKLCSQQCENLCSRILVFIIDGGYLRRALIIDMMQARLRRTFPIHPNALVMNYEGIFCTVDCKCQSIQVSDIRRRVLQYTSKV